MRCYRFQAVDTWFFRESRPHGSAGAQELGSVFPPPATTLLGALRTLAGDRAGVDWSDYAHSAQAQPLRERIGVGEDLGTLDVAACLLAVGQQALFPVPASLLRRGKDTFTRLLPGPAVTCDLGSAVRLSQLEHAGRAEPLEAAWIGADGLERLLTGILPQPGTAIWRLAEHPTDARLVREEPRLGLGRDTTLGIAIDGLLYQTRHVRPVVENLNMAVYLSGAEDLLPEHASVRLGGEGRMATMRADAGPAALPLPTAPKSTGRQRHFALYLLAPARFAGADGTATWLPPGFTDDPAATFTAWRGELAGVRLRLHSAAIGKPIRSGGWDMARQRPKPLASFVPPGSTYFFSIEDDTPLSEVIQRLHGTRLGLQTCAGYGLIACGLWTDIFPARQQGTLS